MSLFGPYRTMSPGIIYMSVATLAHNVGKFRGKTNKHTIFLVTSPDISMEVSTVRVINSISRREFREEGPGVFGERVEVESVDTYSHNSQGGTK